MQPIHFHRILPIKYNGVIYTYDFLTTRCLVHVKLPASEPSTVLRSRRQRNEKQLHTFSPKHVARSADHERKQLLNKVNIAFFFLSIAIGNHIQQKSLSIRLYFIRSIHKAIYVITRDSFLIHLRTTTF